MKPLFARVLLEREKLRSGLIMISDDASKRNAPSRGKVIAVGPNADPSIEVGQTVLFGRHAGDWLKDGEREVFICQDEDILAVVEDVAHV